MQAAPPSSGNRRKWITPRAAAAADRALTSLPDRETRAHLNGARDQFAKILDPEFASNQNGLAGGLLIFGDEWKHWAGDETANCWPDYEIRP